MRNRRWSLPLILVFACASFNFHAQAQPKSAGDYPARPIRLIVPFPPGGSDTVARLVAQKLSERLGQQIVADNRPGAAGVIGTQLATQATPDGYTLLFITASLTITPSFQKLPYDLTRDLAPIAPLATGPLLLVVHPAVAAKSVGELVALSKTAPGSLNYASTGTGSITHLAAELFRRMSGANMVHVPYKGTGPAQTDLLAGQVQVMFGVLAPALPFVRSGKLRALGVTSSKRSSLAPDIPTVSEAGVRNYEAATWYGMLAPAGTSAAIVQKLSGQIEAVLADSDIRARLTTTGFEAAQPMGPKEFGAYIAAEIRKWSSLIKEAGIKLE